MTGTAIWRATRSAVRWRVPVSVVGMSGSGTRCTLARATRVPSEARMIAPSIFAELRQPLRRELGVEQEAARADVQDVGTVADDDERAHLRLQDAVDALAQRRARGDEPQGGVEGFRSALRQHILPVGTAHRAYRACEPVATSASESVETRASNIPGTSGVDTGTIARRKPSRSASCKRRGALGHLAHLAAEPDLADDNRVRCDRAVAARARDRERNREVGARLADAHTRRRRSRTRRA